MDVAPQGITRKMNAKQRTAAARRFYQRVQQINLWADREGWALFNADALSGFVEIQRDDVDAKFPSDEDALHHVQRLAGMGSAMHRAALDMLGTDYESIAQAWPGPAWKPHFEVSSESDGYYWRDLASHDDWSGPFPTAPAAWEFICNSYGLLS